MESTDKLKSTSHTQHGVLCHVMHCGLSESEYKEREILLELQKNSRRWFSQEEFDRLNELSNKMFANVGSPHSA